MKMVIISLLLEINKSSVIHPSKPNKQLAPQAEQLRLGLLLEERKQSMWQANYAKLSRYPPFVEEIPEH